jgi:hypothetical protein
MLNSIGLRFVIYPLVQKWRKSQTKRPGSGGTAVSFTFAATSSYNAIGIAFMQSGAVATKGRGFIF